MKRYIKKILLKIILILIFIFMFSNIKTYATNSFRVMFQDGMSVKSGETIKIPLTLDKVSFDGVQKGVIGFSCNINYDEDVFEYIEFSENNLKYENIVGEKVELVDMWECKYDEDNKSIVFYLGEEYLTYCLDSLNDYSIIGYFTFKVKDNTKSGEYILSVDNIKGGNEDISVSGTGAQSKVIVDGMDENIQNKEDIINTKYEKQDNTITQNEKPIKIQIKQSKSGKKVLIIPDEENGIQIGKVIVDNEKLTKIDGVYSFASKVGVPYEIKFFDIYGELLCTRTIITNSTSNDEVTTIDTEIKEKNKIDYAEEQGNNNENKSPQTGDFVYIAVGILGILACVWTGIFFKRSIL